MLQGSYHTENTVLLWFDLSWSIQGSTLSEYMFRPAFEPPITKLFWEPIGKPTEFSLILRLDGVSQFFERESSNWWEVGIQVLAQSSSLSPVLSAIVGWTPPPDWKAKIVRKGSQKNVFLLMSAKVPPYLRSLGRSKEIHQATSRSPGVPEKRRRHDYKIISYLLNRMHVVTNIWYKYSLVATWMVVLPGINSCWEKSSLYE